MIMQMLECEGEAALTHRNRAKDILESRYPMRLATEYPKYVDYIKNHRPAELERKA